jgi:hypothetical protein
MRLDTDPLPPTTRGVAVAPVRRTAPVEGPNVPFTVRTLLMVGVVSLTSVVVVDTFTVRLYAESPVRSKFPVAAITIVDVPGVNVPELEVKVPFDVIVLPFAVKVPPKPIVTAPAVIARFEPLVSSAVVLVPSLTVNVPPSRSPRVDIVNVCAVPADEVNVTDENSSSARFAPANVIVPAVASLKRTVPVPASHEADVLLFVHAPENT